MEIGVLGAGRMGSHHAHTLRRHPDVEELWVGDLDQKRARGLAEAVDGKSTDVEGVLEAHPDAVFVVVPTSAHADVLHRCLDRELPVFCEKPLAATYGETLKLVERIESTGALLQLGFQRRFDPGYQNARRKVKSGELGTLYTIRMGSSDPNTPPEEYIAHSSGIFRDLFIHDFDILRWVTGREVREVYFRGAVREFEYFGEHDDVDTGAGLITLHGDVPVLMSGICDNAIGYDARMELFGSRDNACVGLDDRIPLRSMEPGPGTLLPQPGYGDFMERFERAYRDEVHHFLDLVRGRAEQRCTARDGLEALRLAMAAERSVRENRPVSMEEIGE